MALSNRYLMQLKTPASNQVASYVLRPIPGQPKLKTHGSAGSIRRWHDERRQGPLFLVGSLRASELTPVWGPKPDYTYAVFVASNVLSECACEFSTWFLAESKRPTSREFRSLTALLLDSRSQCKKEVTILSWFFYAPRLIQKMTLQESCCGFEAHSALAHGRIQTRRLHHRFVHLRRNHFQKVSLLHGWLTSPKIPASESSQ